jgi:cyclopropane fatty-acyl-phospholipid synthase-like methyltransferase
LLPSVLAIHHLSAEHKQRLLQHAYESLAPGGILIWKDPFLRSNDDTPSVFNADQIKWIESSWESIRSVCAHLASHSCTLALHSVSPAT